MPTNPDTSYGAVITGSTPLETELFATRPRLHFTAAGLAELRADLARPDTARIWASAIRIADNALANPAPADAAKGGDIRGFGDRASGLAIAYLLTDDRKYLDGAVTLTRTVCNYSHQFWHGGLAGGHFQHGFGCLYDWLHGTLDAETKELLRATLHRSGRAMFEEFGLHKGWSADAYTCNHMGVMLAGLTASAGALYGEVPDIGPWFKLIIEKLRVISAALGDDGVSHEGIGYGGYFTEYILRAADIMLSLTGFDFCRRTEWIRNQPLVYMHSAVPPGDWSAPNAVINFGDGVRSHWYDPTAIMRIVARQYRDGHAQRWAQMLQDDRVGSPGVWSLVWYDPTVEPRDCSALPTHQHFTDKDMVFTRDHWGPGATVFALRCGPHFGHHALREYEHDIGGGHMHPDAGTFQLLAGGERFVIDDGYTWKTTHYQNTLTVNGIGQTGDNREWFEGLELRLEKRGPRITHASSDTSTDIDTIVADATDAYEHAAKLKRFVRHVLVRHPRSVTLVDEIETAEPSTLELFFHSDYAFERGSSIDRSAGIHVLRGGKFSARVVTWLVVPTADGVRIQSPAMRTFKEDFKHTSGHIYSSGQVLAVNNAEKLSRAVFVTTFDLYPSDAPVLESATLRVDADGSLALKLPLGPSRGAWSLRPFQTDRSKPVFV